MGQAEQQSRTLPLQQFRLAREIIQTEAQALDRLAQRLPSEFTDAVELICQCQGSVIVTGIGKAGWIAQKVSATMASTGTLSHYIHPSEAMHGDLGRIGPRDIVLVFSNSGETGEIVQLLPTFQKTNVSVISVVGSEDNSLSRASTVSLSYGKVPEACPMGLAPSTSTALMLALGDALALVASFQKGFRPIDFAGFHPGGSLGMKLSRVDEIMRLIQDCRVASENHTVRDTFVSSQGPGRRTGAVLLIRDSGELSGIYTDSDLARLLERGDDHLLDEPIHRVMTANPKSVVSGTETAAAVEILASNNISELPVVSHSGQPVGIIDITDVLGLMPRD